MTRMPPLRALALGSAASIAAVLLWHGPGGAGNGLSDRTVRQTRTMLDHYEMQQIDVVADRAPLRRRLVLSGPADDFQRTEMVRMVEEVPGVAEARWNRPRDVRIFPMPLALEAVLMALVAFAAGAIIAYVGALRARSQY